MILTGIPPEINQFVLEITFRDPTEVSHGFSLEIYFEQFTQAFLQAFQDFSNNN